MEAAEDVAKSPEDEDAIAALRQQLKKILTAPENAVLAAEIEEILASYKSDSGVNVYQPVSGNENQVIGVVQGGSVSYKGGDR